MMLRIAAALLAVAAPAALCAQTPAKPAPATPQAKLIRVELITSAGVIVMELDAGRAPITAGNFLRYIDLKRYDGATFWRSMRITPDFGVVQGGWKGDPKKVLKPIPHEPTSKTGILHDGPGVVSMARLAPGTAASDFFITISAIPSFDADPTKPGDEGAGYAAFGRVVEGMDVVKKIYVMPTSPTMGEGFMKGQYLSPPLKILSVRRVTTPPAAPKP